MVKLLFRLLVAPQGSITTFMVGFIKPEGRKIQHTIYRWLNQYLHDYLLVYIVTY